MGKVKQIFVDLEHEGPDQEPGDFEIVAVAVPVLLEVICVCLGLACAFVWVAYYSGRLPELPV
jgi:hypothetical protein